MRLCTRLVVRHVQRSTQRSAVSVMLVVVAAVDFAMWYGHLAVKHAELIIHLIVMYAKQRLLCHIYGCHGIRLWVLV